MSNILDIADAFLRKDSLDSNKIQFLCYYYKGWSMALMDADYLFDYDFYVTEYGPFNQTLLNEYGFETDVVYKASKKDLTINDMERQLIEDVWATYGEYDTDTLRYNIKREPPYLLARVGNPFEEEEIDQNIRTEHMNIYFNSLLENDSKILSIEDYYPPYDEEIVNTGRRRK